MNNMHPFGMRVFVKVDNQLLDNIGTDYLRGIIIDVSTELKKAQKNKEYIKDMNTLLYYLSSSLQIGAEVLFKKDNNLVDNQDGIYNVPVELIRQISSSE